MKTSKQSVPLSASTRHAAINRSIAYCTHWVGKLSAARQSEKFPHYLCRAGFSFESDGTVHHSADRRGKQVRWYSLHCSMFGTVHYNAEKRGRQVRWHSHCCHVVHVLSEHDDMWSFIQYILHFINNQIMSVDIA